MKTPFLPMLRRTLVVGLAVLPLPPVTAAEPGEKPLHKFLSVEDKSNESRCAYMWLDIMQEATAQEVDAMARARRSFPARWRSGRRRCTTPGRRTTRRRSARDSAASCAARRPNTRSKTSRRRSATPRIIRCCIVFTRIKDYLDGEMKSWATTRRSVSHDPTKPEGVGYLAAQAVIEYRRHDGANQFGDEAGGERHAVLRLHVLSAGQSAGQDHRSRPLAADHVHAGRRKESDAGISHAALVSGEAVRAWKAARSSARRRRRRRRPTTSAEEGNRTGLAYNNSLTNEQKAIVEFMRDGPRSTGQSGHWLRFAQDVSRRDKHTSTRT